MEDTALAQQLIDTVRRTVNADAALVQDRVAYTLNYMSQVATPNVHTLNHIRHILRGQLDSVVALSAASKIEEEG